MTIWEEKLLGELVGLARATVGNEHLISEPVTGIIVEILAANVFTEGQYAGYSAKIDEAKRKMVPDCFLCANPCGRTAALDWRTLEEEPEEVQAVKFSIFQELQKIAVSPRNWEQDQKLYRGLVILGLEGYSPEELSSLFSE